MKPTVSLAKLADDVRRIYFSDNGQPEENIETYLRAALGDRTAVEKIEILQKLAAEFGQQASESTLNNDQSQEILTRLFSLVLGGNVRPKDLSSEELLERLADSLNTVFDTLNHLIKLINLTLQGNDGTQETIRRVIGHDMDGAGSHQSLETYLGQISNAFLIAHRAFQRTTEKLVGQLLHEFDPSELSKNGKTGFKFGALRKAELYDRFETKFKKCRQWYDSDRFHKDMLREFERHSGKMIAK